MLNRHRYFADLRAVLKATPPGTLDREGIEALERRHGHRFADPPEIVERWLLDEQRRAQASEPPSSASSHHAATG